MYVSISSNYSIYYFKQAHAPCSAQLIAKISVVKDLQRRHACTTLVPDEL